MPEQTNAAIAGITPGAPIIVYLHTPREKIWGILGELNTVGVYLLGIDLNTFDDWTGMILRGERNIGLTRQFFPIWRIEKVALDEPLDDIPSLADKFYSRTGITIEEYLGIVR